MMEVRSSDFIPLAEIAIHDGDLQKAVQKGTGNAVAKRQLAVFAEGQAHGEAMRQQAAEAKRRALRHLPDLLEQAERQMTANGMKVLWASDGAEVLEHVRVIARRHAVQHIVKAKSMISEEIALNHALEADGLHVVETDLGEFIVQIAGETPRTSSRPSSTRPKNPSAM